MYLASTTAYLSWHAQIHHAVSPDSLLILHAAEEVVAEEGFDELLDSVRDRVDEIESLHRTRELTVRGFWGASPFAFNANAFPHVLTTDMRSQFKDVDKGDRIRLTVDKGGARLVEG